jgi:hypothetical protein
LQARGSVKKHLSQIEKLQKNKRLRIGQYPPQGLSLLDETCVSELLMTDKQ